MSQSTGLDCPVCFDEISSTNASALRTCGHVFCNTCITEFLGSRLGNRKCPKCRIAVPFSEKPLKLFVDCSVLQERPISSPRSSRRSSGNPSSPNSGADPFVVRDLVEQLWASSASGAASKQQVDKLTLQSSELRKEKTELEKRLRKSQTLANTVRDETRRKVTMLEHSLATASTDVDRLRRENSFLETNNHNLAAAKSANEAYIKDLQNSLRAERQASQTRLQRDLAVHTLQLASERKKLELFTVESDARARQNDEAHAAAMASLIEAKKEVYSQSELIQKQRDEAWEVMEQFRAQGWNPTQSNASLINNLVLLTRERDRLAEIDAARTAEYMQMSSNYEADLQERDALLAEKAVYMKAGAQLGEQVEELTRRLSHAKPVPEAAFPSKPSTSSFSHYR